MSAHHTVSTCGNPKGSSNPVNCGYSQAMGLVPRDVNVTNGFIGQATACNLDALRADLNFVKSLSFKDLMMLTYNNEATISYDLEPRGSLVTIFQLDNVADVTGTINLSVISSEASVGDTILLMIVTGASGIVTMIYDSSFFLTRCGGITTTEGIQPNFRWIRRFIFDGQVWVNTDDNC
jgi:hypothetical protein